MTYLCSPRFSSYGSLSIVATCSRAAITAGEGVTFDATGTTQPGVTNPFRDFLYIWNFGDGSAGTWSNGAQTGASKNSAYTPVAAHVYETANTYTPTLTVFTGLAFKTYTLPDIVVTAANTTYTGANTIAIAANSLPSAGAGGVPAGATCINATATYGSADFDAAVAANLATGKRVLFKGGDTFTASTASSAVSNSRIGAYGTGSAIVNATNIDGVIKIADTAIDKFTAHDIAVVGSGALDTGISVRVEGDCTNITLLRVDSDDACKGLIMTGVSVFSGVVQDCELINIGVQGYPIFGAMRNAGVLGCLLGDIISGGDHCFRLQPGYKVAVAHNTMRHPGNTGQHCFTIRANEHTTGSAPDPVNDTQYVCSYANKLIPEDDGVVIAMHVAPASTSQNHWISDVISDSDWIIAGADTQNAFVSECRRLTVRNALANMSGGDTFRTCYSVNPANTAGAPAPDDCAFYNVTGYASDASSSFTVVSLDGSITPITNSIVINNIGYAPSATTAKLLLTAGTVTNTTASNNSTDNQVKNTLCFTDATPSDPNNGDFDPAGYAVAGGLSSAPVYTDLLTVQRSYGNKQPSLDMGAVQTTVN